MTWILHNLHHLSEHNLNNLKCIIKSISKKQKCLYVWKTVYLNCRLRKPCSELAAIFWVHIVISSVGFMPHGSRDTEQTMKHTYTRAGCDIINWPASLFNPSLSLSYVFFMPAAHDDESFWGSFEVPDWLVCRHLNFSPICEYVRHDSRTICIDLLI